MELDNKTKIKFSVLAIISIVIFCIAIAPISLQNDTFYTVKIGEHILEHGIDMQDPFSWHELPYTYPHWAYDVGMYLVFKVGGYTGIYVTTVILTAILGIVIYTVCTKYTGNRLVSFLVTMLTMYMLRDFIAARAQLVTFILFVLTIFFIEKFLETRKMRYAVFLVVIPIMIANLHLAVWPFYFVLYLPYIGEYAISYISKTSSLYRKLQIKMLKRKLGKVQKPEIMNLCAEKITRIENKEIETTIKSDKLKANPYKINVERNANIKFLILIMVICLFTGFLTPLGSTPYTYLIKTMKGNTTEYINEHMPLTLINNQEFLSLLILYFAILMFTDTKIRLKDLFLSGGLLVLALKTRRQTSMFIMLGSSIIAKLISDIFNKYDKGGCEKVIKQMVTFGGKLITIGVVLIISAYTIKPKVKDEFVSKSSYPIQAAEFIRKNIDLKNMRLYNEYNYGSYLLMQDIPVFIDSRADLYTPEFNGKKDIFSDFINIANIGTYYEDKFDEYEITHVLIYKNARLNMFISKSDRYEELYSDDYFLFYKRLEMGDVE